MRCKPLQWREGYEAGYTGAMSGAVHSLTTAVPAAGRGRALALVALLCLAACKQDLAAPSDARSDGGVSAGDAGPPPDAARKPPRPPDVDDTDAGEDRACQDSASCSDGLRCNGIERCALGRCLPGEPPPCTAEHPCTEAEHAAATQGCDCRVPDYDVDNYPAAVCAGPGDLRDCDDSKREIYPRNVEVCDPTTDVDEDCDPTTYGQLDVDGDGEQDERCCNVDDDGVRHCGRDCRDDLFNVNRGVSESCDDVDNDCNGLIDDGPGTLRDKSLHQPYYRDVDADSQGDDDEALVLYACKQPKGYASEPGDCADDDSHRFTGAPELCNGINDDCDRDGTVDEGVTLPALPATQLECRGEAGFVITACERDGMGRPLYDDCGGGWQDGCETPVTTLRNCRACGRSCHFACGSSECDEIIGLAAGLANTCAITRERKAACWGGNARGQIGDDTTAEAKVARRVSVLSDVQQISVGDGHACAIEGAQRAAYCWGDNGAGQLGDTFGPSSNPVPVPVNAPDQARLNGVSEIAAGAAHTCAVVSGSVMCWGLCTGGRCGDGDVGMHELRTPDLVRRTATGQAVRNAQRVVAGAQHSCLLTASGTVECWGDNSAGQLGRGEDVALANAASSAPVLGLDAVEQLVAGRNHSCALQAGTVYCWGSNFGGQLGGVTTTATGAARNSDPTPTAVPGLSGIATIAAGVEVSCAIDGDGALFCWGSNLFGELGELASGKLPPTRIALGKVAEVVTAAHVCARLVDGPVHCWGRNNSAQLGSGESSTLPEPLPRELHWLYGSEP
jgi:alpha-tubulin suppressor-like RCC1 family protein